MLKTAVISGASKGIGLAIAEKFLANGFRVISVSRTGGELSLKADLYAHKPVILNFDLSEKENVMLAVEKIRSLTSEIDVLVNNAGIFIPGEVHGEDDAIFEKQMALNLNAAYYLSKYLLPLMKGNDVPYIFNICSTASVMAYSSGGSYSISKHALLGLSRVLRAELMQKGIAVTAVMPGATLTESWNGTDLPAYRFMRSESIAETVWTAWMNRDNCVVEEILLRPLSGDI